MTLKDLLLDKKFIDGLKQAISEGEDFDEDNEGVLHSVFNEDLILECVVRYLNSVATNNNQLSLFN